MRIVRALKTVNYKLWFALFITMLLPAVYQAVRIFFLGDFPDDSGVNIASQLAWVNLLYEVLYEILIVPLCFLLGRSLADKRAFSNKVRTGLFVTAAVYLVMSALMAVFAEPLTVLMAQDASLIEETVSYVRLEAVAILFGMLWKFTTLVLSMLHRLRYLYVVLGVQMVLSVLSDTFLISALPVSLKMGVNGIAITDIGVNFILVFLAVAFLAREGIRVFDREWDFSWLKEWMRVGKFSGLEGLLRNVAYLVMIMRLINIITEQGNYWIAESFITQWLLLPSLALGDLVKKEVGAHPEYVREKSFGYFCLAGIFTVLWLLSIPTWRPILQYVLNVKDFETVYYIVLLQSGFYLTYIFNHCIMDATFYGLGKTQYLVIQSIIIDVLYYGLMFILYLAGVFVPTLTGICLMFGCGMLLNFVPTIVQYVRMLRNEGIRIDFCLSGGEAGPALPETAPAASLSGAEDKDGTEASRAETALAAADNAADDGMGDAADNGQTAGGMPETNGKSEKRAAPADPPEMSPETPPEMSPEAPREDGA